MLPCVPYGTLSNPPVVDLDVALVQVELVVLAVVHAPRERVPGVAGHVVRQHEHDVRVWDAQAPHRVVHRQGVGHVPVVEPETRRAHLRKARMYVGRQAVEGLFVVYAHLVKLEWFFCVVHRQGAGARSGSWTEGETCTPAEKGRA